MLARAAARPGGGLRPVRDFRQSADSAFEGEQERFLHRLADPAQEARGGSAVDEPVVVGEGERQHEPRLEFTGFPVVHLLHGASGNTEDRDLWRAHYRREAGTADAAQVADAEVATLHLVRRELAVAGLLGQLLKLQGKFDDVLPVGVPDGGTENAVV